MSFYLDCFDVFHWRRLEEGEFALDETSSGTTQTDHQRDDGDDDSLDRLQFDQRQKDGHQFNQLDSSDQQKTQKESLQLELLLLFQTSYNKNI
jgi:hypothetical protein